MHRLVPTSINSFIWLTRASLDPLCSGYTLLSLLSLTSCLLSMHGQLWAVGLLTSIHASNTHSEADGIEARWCGLVPQVGGREQGTPGND